MSTTERDVDTTCGPCRLGAHRWCARVVSLGQLADDADCACLATDARSHPDASEGGTDPTAAAREVLWSFLSLPRRLTALVSAAAASALAVNFAIEAVPTANGQLGAVVALAAAALAAAMPWVVAGLESPGGAR